MKSKAQKRREARERIERKLPDLTAEIALVNASIKAAPAPQQQELVDHRTKLLAKQMYMFDEIARIKAREAGRGARKDPHPEIAR